MPPAATLMVQGATSSAGKSLLVAGLCRAYQRRGVKVAPFKPQNMALNSAVTADGGEIGRAQALQAQAAGLEPHTDMNPVLLKPTGEAAAQVIIGGRVQGTWSACEYHRRKPAAADQALAAYRRLASRFDLVLVEGAGSPAEINLREHDFANMGFALAAACPVLLVADIERGGVFAHLKGTLDCLSEPERALVRGLVINRFRGARELLDSGLDWLRDTTRKPVVGVLPYLTALHLDAEDSLDTGPVAGPGRLRVVIPRLPRLSNHTDFDALVLQGEVSVEWVESGPPPPADWIILPGSKHTRADLAWLVEQGWPAALARHLRYGGKLLGLCGGYQMLGRRVHDPEGVEGEPGSSEGLGFLAVETTLEPRKHLREASGTWLAACAPVPVSGYEIHMGVTTGADCARPLLRLGERTDGAVSPDGQVAGCYLHGLLDTPAACAAVLEWAGLSQIQPVDRAMRREQSLDRLADMLEAELDLDQLMRWAEKRAAWVH